jgi:hypothetical protein
LAQQEKASLHRDEENIRIVTKRTSVATSNTTPSAQLQGCHQEGGGFLPRRRAFLHPTSFLSRWGFHHFPQACFFVISKGGAEEPSRLRAHKPLPHTFIQYSKIAVEAKGPRPVSKGGLLATAG